MRVYKYPDNVRRVSTSLNLSIEDIRPKKRTYMTPQSPTMKHETLCLKTAVPNNIL